MGQDRQLRGYVIAMLVGAAFLVLGQFGAWPPETGLERALTGLTVAVVLIAVGLTIYEWRQGRKADLDDGAGRPNARAPSWNPGRSLSHRHASICDGSSGAPITISVPTRRLRHPCSTAVTRLGPWAPLDAARSSRSHPLHLPWTASAPSSASSREDRS